jgi:hypothetical protein
MGSQRYTHSPQFSIHVPTRTRPVIYHVDVMLVGGPVLPNSFCRLMNGRMWLRNASSTAIATGSHPSSNGQRQTISKYRTQSLFLYPTPRSPTLLERCYCYISGNVYFSKGVHFCSYWYSKWHRRRTTQL